MKLPSLKIQLIIFLFVFAAFLFVKDRNTAFVFAVFTAVISALGFEAMFSGIGKHKTLSHTTAKLVEDSSRWPVSCFLKNVVFSESAVISGLIVGIVLSSDAPWWIFVIASLFAVASKYFIRFNNKHIFNPAALAIFLVTIIFGVYTQWRGTYYWYILAPAGTYFIFKIRKLEVLLSYFITAMALFAAQAWIQKVSFINIFGYFSYFFIFIMLIEPKTTPITKKGKVIFGMEVAGLIFVLTLLSARFDVELLSLLIANVTVPLLNRKT